MAAMLKLQSLTSIHNQKNLIFHWDGHDNMENVRMFI